MSISTTSRSRSRVGSILRAVASDAGAYAGAPNVGRSIGQGMQNLWDGPAREGGSTDVSRQAGVHFKGILKKRKKNVKVSPLLRKKIKSVVTKTKPTGKYQAIQQQEFNCNVAGYQKVQYYDDYMNYGTVFDGRRLMYISSRLFNNMTPKTSSPQYADAGMFDYHNHLVDITKNQLVVNLKSNSKRQYKLTFFICSPKHSAESTNGPIEQWDNLFNELGPTTPADQQIIKPGVNWSRGNAAIAKYWLGQDPRMFKQYNKDWKVSTVDVVLNAGEYTSFVIPLYTGHVDFQKMFTGTILNTFQKLNTHMFVRMVTDLTTTAIGSLRSNDAAANFISAEYILQTEIAMPDQAGFIYSAGLTGAQDLNLRHDSITYDHFGPQTGDTQANLLRIDPLDPATSIV